MQIKYLCTSVHKTLSHLSISHWIWSAIMLKQDQTWWMIWSDTKMDRKWFCMKICCCCKTLLFTLTHCCPLLLDLTSVRLTCPHFIMEEFSAWTIHSAVYIRGAKSILRKQDKKNSKVRRVNFPIYHSWSMARQHLQTWLCVFLSTCMHSSRMVSPGILLCNS